MSQDTGTEIPIVNFNKPGETRTIRADERGELLVAKESIEAIAERVVELLKAEKLA